MATSRFNAAFNRLCVRNLTSNKPGAVDVIKAYRHKAFVACRKFAADPDADHHEFEDSIEGFADAAEDEIDNLPEIPNA